MTFDQIPANAQFIAQFDGKRFARVSRTDRELVARRVEAFGVLDAKGRELGHKYTIDREVWIVDGSSPLLCELDKLADRLEETFVVMPQALRDGVKFGAIPVSSSKRFRTLDEAEAYGDDVIARAAKKAAKK